MLQELNAEQVLFYDIVQSLFEAPFAIHAQCQTKDTCVGAVQPSCHLPTARLVNKIPALTSVEVDTDVMAEASTSTLASASASTSADAEATAGTCRTESGIAIIVNGHSEEEAEVMLSSKTDKTFNLKALSMFNYDAIDVCTYAYLLFCRCIYCTGGIDFWRALF